MRIRILTTGLLAVAIFGLLFTWYTYQVSKDTAIEYKQESISLPIQIIIPSIKVDATIEQVGQTPDGSMDVPILSSNVGWYKFGPRPKDLGSSVIDGHVVDPNGERGVFYNLRDLKKGDEIIILDNRKTRVIFSVRELRIYDKKSDTRNVFYSDDGKAHLNLITCEGFWDETVSGYTQRLVVFTDLIN